MTSTEGVPGVIAQLHGSTLRQALTAVLRREGLLGLYGGVWAVAAGAGWAEILNPMSLFSLLLCPR